MENVIRIRLAEEKDIPHIVELYRELAVTTSQAEQARNPSSDDYEQVLTEISSDLKHQLLVAEHQDEVVGTLVLLIVPNLSHNATPWAFLENLIVSQSNRRKGIARLLLEYAVNRARDSGCYKVELCSDKRRTEAHRLYRSVGFDASAYGFRLYF